MAVTIDLRADLTQVQRALGGLRGQAPVVIARAINRTLVPVRATAAREIARDMRLRVGTARGAMALQRATPARPTGAVAASGKRIPLIEFRARQTQPGVSYDLGRGRQVAAGSFIPTFNTGRRGVFRRRGRARLPIAELHGPSIPRVFVQDKIAAAMRAVAGARWPREAEQQLRFLLSRLGVTRG